MRRNILVRVFSQRSMEQILVEEEWVQMKQRMELTEVVVVVAVAVVVEAESQVS